MILVGARVWRDVIAEGAESSAHAQAFASALAAAGHRAMALLRSGCQLLVPCSWLVGTKPYVAAHRCVLIRDLPSERAALCLISYGPLASSARGWLLHIEPLTFLWSSATSWC